jgi:hypothetical protein
MGCPRFDGLSKYRWPLLCCVCLGDDMCRGVAARRARRSSATPNPGDVAAKAMAKIHRGLIQGQLRGRCPKLELVTVSVAAMAVVATDRHVHRERAETPRRGLMQRTNSIPLYPRSLRGGTTQGRRERHRDADSFSALSILAASPFPSLALSITAISSASHSLATVLAIHAPPAGSGRARPANID